MERPQTPSDRDCTVVSKRHPIDHHFAPTGDHKHAYRACNIPSSYDADSLATVLSKVLECEGEGLRIYSLASDKAHNSGTRTATLSFHKRPAALVAARKLTVFVPKSTVSTNPHPVYIDGDFLGFTPLSPSQTDHLQVVDCVAVHGWGGHALGSFRDPDSCYVWLRDHVAPGFKAFRVWTYGYDSQLQSRDTYGDMHGYAQSFRQLLKALRAKIEFEAPIVLIAHSLGGLLVKEAVVEMAAQDPGSLRSISSILFFGVPSDGMDTAAMASMVMDKPQRLTLEMLNKDCGQTLRERQHNRFCTALHKDCKLICFYELVASPTVREDASGRWMRDGEATLLVSQASATRRRPLDCDGIGIDADHMQIVKFAPSDRYKYPKVEAILTEIAEYVISKTAQQPEVSLTLTNAHKPEGYKDFMQSLFFDDMMNRYNEISNAIPGTCLWIWDNHVFRQWQIDGGMLWLKGNPGTGKSTLLKAIISTMRARRWMHKKLLLTFHFHRRGSPLQYSLLGLYRAVLHQLLDYDCRLCPEFIATFVKRQETQGQVGSRWDWHENELQHELQSAILRVLQSTSIDLFIDALDEAGEEPASKLIANLATLTGLAESKPMKLSICFTCRRFPILSMENCEEISLESSTANDITAVIKKKIEFWPAIPEDLVSSVASQASGSFQWVVLLMDSLIRLHKQGRSLQALRQKLRVIPSALNDLYATLLDDIDSEDRPLALTIFSWVALAEPPLYVREIRQLLAFDGRYSSLQEWESSDDYIEDDAQMSRRLLALSQGLIEIQKSTGPVQFIHQSVADYVTAKGLDDLDSVHDGRAIDRGYQKLCQMCIRLVTLPTVPPKYSMIFRDAPYMVSHYASKAEQRGNIGQWFLKAFHFPMQKSPVVYSEWFQKQSLQFTHPDEIPLLHEICGNGLSSVLKLILEIQPDIDVNLVDKSGITPLMTAAHRGQGVIVQQLIDAGADLRQRDNHENDALLYAIRNNRVEVVRILLDTGKMEINRCPGADGYGALHQASSMGQLETIKALLAMTTLDINLRTGRGQTALHICAKYDGAAVARLILSEKERVNINLEDDSQDTPLSTALKSRNTSIARLLLAEDGIKVNVMNKESKTPLILAVMEGYVEIARLLLAKGAIPDQAGRYRRTPLSWAAEKGFVRIVRLLLETGQVDVQKINHWDGKSPLDWALHGGHQKIVEMMLEYAIARVGE